MGRSLEPYLSQFDVEKLEMASVMGICAGLVGPKSENVEKVLVFKAFFEGVKTGRRTPGKQTVERKMGLWGHSGVIWGHIGMTLGNFGVTLVRL